MKLHQLHIKKAYILTFYIGLQVADGALRCFASLADRFTRRGVDPAPLAQHGLVDDLLTRLSLAGLPAPGSSLSGTPGTLTATPETKSSPSISTVISLLSTLCRGSPTVTQDLLRSELPDAIESALQGDERYCFTVLRCQTKYQRSVAVV